MQPNFIDYIVAGAIGVAGAAYGLDKGLTILLALAACSATFGGRFLWRKWSGSQTANSLIGSPAASLEGAVSEPPEPAVPTPRVRRAQHFATALIVVIAGFVVVMNLLNTPTEVTPDHSGAVMESAGVVALLAALATFGLTIRIKLRSGSPNWLSSLALAVPAGLFCGIATMFALDNAFQLIDFPKGETVQSVAYLPIERAYRTGSGHNDYNVQLVGPFANLDVSKQDYETAFNGADNAYPENYCLRATIQRAGEAMRIMQSSSRPFPRGSVVKCPAAVTTKG
jgi:hypothetical protein